MNRELRKNNKREFEKGFLKLMNNWILLKYVRNHGDINFTIIEARRNYLVSERNYRTTKLFSNNLLAIKIKKEITIVSKLDYLGLSILELSKIVM